MQSSQSEPRWLPVSEVIDTNREQVQQTGEPHGIRDRSLLESACAVPQNRWWYAQEADVVVLAVALLFAVARNHPFVQGNKRTGLMAALQFLVVNGYRTLTIEDDGVLADLIVDVLKGGRDEDAVVSHLKTLLKPPKP